MIIYIQWQRLSSHQATMKKILLVTSSLVIKRNSFMFPQELCIQFETEKIVKGVSITSYGIKKVEIQTCENDSVVNFTKQAEQGDVPSSSGLQNISLTLGKSPRVKVLKIVILEGYEDFFTIQQVSIQ